MSGVNSAVMQTVDIFSNLTKLNSMSLDHFHPSVPGSREWFLSLLQEHNIMSESPDPQKEGPRILGQS